MEKKNCKLKKTADEEFMKKMNPGVGHCIFSL